MIFYQESGVETVSHGFFYMTPCQRAQILI